MGKSSRGRKEWFQPRKHHHYIPKEFQTPTNSDTWLISHYVMQLVPLLLPRPSRLASLASITQFCVHWQRQAPHNTTDEGRTLQYAHPLPFVHPQSIPNPTHSTHAWSLRLGSYRSVALGVGCSLMSCDDFLFPRPSLSVRSVVRFSRNNVLSATRFSCCGQHNGSGNLSRKLPK